MQTQQQTRFFRCGKCNKLALKQIKILRSTFFMHVCVGRIKLISSRRSSAAPTLFIIYTSGASRYHRASINCRRPTDQSAHMTRQGSTKHKCTMTTTTTSVGRRRGAYKSDFDRHAIIASQHIKNRPRQPTSLPISFIVTRLYFPSILDIVV